MTVIGEWSLPVLILTHDPFVIFSLPCPAEEGSHRVASAGTWHPDRLNHNTPTLAYSKEWADSCRVPCPIFERSGAFKVISSCCVSKALFSMLQNYIRIHRHHLTGLQLFNSVLTCKDFFSCIVPGYLFHFDLSSMPVSSFPIHKSKEHEAEEQSSL